VRARMTGFATDSHFGSSYWHAFEHIDGVAKSRLMRQFSTYEF
jgi:hypothetical protein